MKYLSYTVGIVVVVVAALLMINGNSAKDNSAYAAEDTTTFSIQCKGANIFRTPTEVAGEIEYDGSGEIISPPSVVVTGAVAGGDTDIGVSAAESSTAGWAYVILESPKMRHIYTCQGVVVTKADLDWKYAADNVDMFVGYAAAGQTVEGNFTEITDAYSEILADVAKGPGANFIYADAALRMIMKASVDVDVPDSTPETMNVGFQSTPE